MAAVDRANEFIVALKGFLRALNEVYTHNNLWLLITVVNTSGGGQRAYHKFVEVMVPFGDECERREDSFLARLHLLFPAALRLDWEDIWASLGEDSKEAMWQWLLHLVVQAGYEGEEDYSESEED